MSDDPLEIRPFRVAVPDAVLDDLADRLHSTRLADEVGAEPWADGTDRAYLGELLAYWADGYDWRTQEARLNRLPHAVTVLDDQPIHFLHLPSPEPGALPLIMTHGWPGSFVEFLDVVGPLSDPVGHGGRPEDAFHVVVPSLPGYGFSGPTTGLGWHPRRIAGAFDRIMTTLGYARYAAQGGDWGAAVSANLADIAADRLVGLHLNFPLAGRPRSGPPVTVTAEEQAALDALYQWRRTGAGYAKIQATRPHSLGFALEDSPAGLAAWIVEKFRAWSDCGGDLERSFTKDQLLTNIMIYWVTATATSSARLYAEARRFGSTIPERFLSVPTGIAQYPGDVTRLPRSWIEQRYNVTYWSNPERGGHFAAMEAPEVFVDDVRAFFRLVR